MRMIAKMKNFLSDLWEDCFLDIRRTGNGRCAGSGRWYDQKVTPDVMSAVCYVIASESMEGPFTSKLLWHSDSFQEQVTGVFDKPDSRNRKAFNEYNKFIAHPLNVLFMAGILSRSRGKHGHSYSVASEQARDLIERMADSEKAALEFLSLYISTAAQHSGLGRLFQDFFDRQDKESFQILKNGYINFIHENTPIQKDKEPRRVFPKVLNIWAFVEKKKGTRRGRMSDDRITLLDIRYNRINSRDVRKPKSIPRQVWESPNAADRKSAIIQYHGLGRVVKEIKSFHQNISEVDDSHSGEGVPIGVQAHHIFPKSQHPEFAETRENIILLAPNQHSHAHSGDGVCQIAPAYQGFCLTRKLRTIELCMKDPNCNFYSFSVFKRMLLATGVLGTEKGIDMLKIRDVERKIWDHYMEKKKPVK